MKIQARKVNVKRHTTGYKIGGKWRTMQETVQLANEGRLDNIAVKRSRSKRSYITANPNATFSLEELPIKVAA